MSAVVIIGSGVVGTATGKGLTEVGHAVRFVDVKRSRVDDLRREGLAASTEIDLSGPPAFVILTLPTPAKSGRYDLTAFEAGVRSVGQALRGAGSRHTVVVRSTVPPGTCDHLVRPLLEQASGRRAGEHFGLASNPEFLRAASAREDFAYPWMTVIGSHSRRTVERLVELYRPFGGDVRTFGTTMEAELAKCAHNLYNATKISFWNEIWRVGQELGIGIDRVAATVAASAEASINPEYGIRAGAPYGGACLPKDTAGFLGFAADLGVPMPVLSGVVAVNEALAAQRNGNGNGHAIHLDGDSVEIDLMSA